MIPDLIRMPIGVSGLGQPLHITRKSPFFLNSRNSEDHLFFFNSRACKWIIVGVRGCNTAP